jgi:hypothetical protein
MVLEEKISKKLSVYFHSFAIISPLERGNLLHLYKLASPPQGSLLPSLVKIGPVVFENKTFK